MRLDIRVAGGGAGITETEPVAEPGRRRLLLLFSLLIAWGCSMAEYLLSPPVIAQQILWRVQGRLQTLQKESCRLSFSEDEALNKPCISVSPAYATKRQLYCCVEMKQELGEVATRGFKVQKQEIYMAKIVH